MIVTHAPRPPVIRLVRLGLAVVVCLGVFTCRDGGKVKMHGETERLLGLIQPEVD